MRACRNEHAHRRRGKLPACPPRPAAAIVTGKMRHSHVGNRGRTTAVSVSSLPRPTPAPGRNKVFVTPSLLPRVVLVLERYGGPRPVTDEVPPVAVPLDAPTLHRRRARDAPAHGQRTSASIFAH
ncbi:hypothetical protein EVAR_61098_1 [Eumeta japonica]|uniref:Uncharacterized protein n=1 Tax=Eumeta variegata TaxID=151549 RepID=A0A4C1YLN8_EUMVA|nr:hypothetical protein EVAR_61098_1 [Eumeta japonica]